MSELFWITAANPVARAHLGTTVAEGVPLGEFAQLRKDVRDQLSEHAVRGRIYCWGARPGTQNIGRWNKLEAGDLGLIYTDGSFRYLVRVYAKTRNARLAARLWRRENGETWEYMYFFDMLGAIDVSIESLREAIGYRRDWRPQGFSFVREPRLEAASARFGSTEALVEALTEGRIRPRRAAGRPGARLGVDYKKANERPSSRRGEPFDVDPDKVDRGLRGHAVTQNRLASFLERQGLTPLSPAPGEPNFDLAWMKGRTLFVAEIKSITTKNSEQQLRLGLGQLLRFRHLLVGTAPRVNAVLAAERPPIGAEAWRELCAGVGVVLTWPSRFASDLR